MGEVVDAGLGAVLAVYGAGGRQLRRRVNGPRVGHVLGESAAADVTVLMAAHVVVAVGWVL